MISNSLYLIDEIKIFVAGQLSLLEKNSSDTIIFLLKNYSSSFVN